MNPLDKLVLDCADSTTTEIAQRVVGETILAILATDHRHAMFTTFDKAAIEGATQRIVDSVTKHWNFK